MSGHILEQESGVPMLPKLLCSWNHEVHLRASRMLSSYFGYGQGLTTQCLDQREVTFANGKVAVPIEDLSAHPKKKTRLGIANQKHVLPILKLRRRKSSATGSRPSQSLLRLFRMLILVAVYGLSQIARPTPGSLASV